MADAYIFEAARTAIGRRGGSLAATRPDELAGKFLAAMIERAGVDPAQIEDVIMGCVTQLGEQGMNIGRTAALIAGFPITTTGTTVNRMCGSSLQTVNFAAQAVMSGMQDLVLAAGVESMSRVEMGADVAPLSEALTDRFDIVPQGISAELIAKKWGLTRDALDQLTVESHRRALAAISEGYFVREIVPVAVVRPNGEAVNFAVDEGPRADSTLEKVGRLKPAFLADGVVTAASSSQISDGASGVLIGSKAKGEALGLEARARIVATAVAGVDPTMMLTGPIPVTQKVLEKAGLRIEDIGLFEVNEAFASVVLAWASDLSPGEPQKLLARTNVNGGAMALGHPLGASGARLLATLLHEMERRNVRYGLATLCIGFGQAVATIIER
ncbi:MAG: thiolase family protein [Bradymonadaceae bacterium]|nr:thiolase family protein [Lujinxingiaceae bacterium]